MPTRLPPPRLRPFPALILALGLAACNEGSGSGPDPVECPDQSVVGAPSAAKTAHAPKKVVGKDLAALEGVAFAPADSVRAWFGGKEVKAAFVLARRLYLAHWKADAFELVDLTIGDEGYDGGTGNINSPLFSPDGKRLAYGGSLSKPAMSFVLDLDWPGAGAWRIPLASSHDAFDPHFLASNEDTAGYRLVFADDPGPVNWSDRCGQFGGRTYRVSVGDSAAGTVAATGWPGSFKGGASKDLAWIGTSYGPSALHHPSDSSTLILANYAQQCNPSMNPFPEGSANMDYLMILGFGGTMKTVGDDITEAIHENLWIYGKEDRIVWRGKLPPDAKYKQWQKPEWSTHPRYATAIALHDYSGTSPRGDLYVVDIGDLASADRSTLREAAGHFRLAEGPFSESSFSHLWVGP